MLVKRQNEVFRIRISLINVLDGANDIDHCKMIASCGIVQQQAIVAWRQPCESDKIVAIHRQKNALLALTIREDRGVNGSCKHLVLNSDDIVTGRSERHEKGSGTATLVEK